MAWALGDRALAPNPPSQLSAARLGRMADSSLRLAAEYAPSNAVYRLRREWLRCGQARRSYQEAAKGGPHDGVDRLAATRMQRGD